MNAVLFFVLIVLSAVIIKLVVAQIKLNTSVIETKKVLEATFQQQINTIALNMLMFKTDNKPWLTFKTMELLKRGDGKKELYAVFYNSKVTEPEEFKIMLWDLSMGSLFPDSDFIFKAYSAIEKEAILAVM